MRYLSGEKTYQPGDSTQEGAGVTMSLLFPRCDDEADKNHLLFPGIYMLGYDLVDLVLIFCRSLSKGIGPICESTVDERGAILFTFFSPLVKLLFLTFTAMSANQSSSTTFGVEFEEGRVL